MTNSYNWKEVSQHIMDNTIWHSQTWWWDFFHSTELYIQIRFAQYYMLLSCFRWSSCGRIPSQNVWVPELWETIWGKIKLSELLAADITGKVNSEKFWGFHYPPAGGSIVSGFSVVCTYSLTLNCFFYLCLNISLAFVVPLLATWWHGNCNILVWQAFQQIEM